MRFAEDETGRGLGGFHEFGDNHVAIGAPGQTGVAYRSMPTDPNVDIPEDAASCATGPGVGLLDKMSIDGAVWTPHSSGLFEAGPSATDRVNFQHNTGFDSPHWHRDGASMAWPIRGVSDRRPQLQTFTKDSLFVSPSSSGSVLLAPRRARASKPNLRRTGCWTCNARRVRCDEQKPQCERCLGSRRVCGSYGSHALEASPNPVPPQTATMNLMASGSLDRYPGVDLASLAGNVVLSYCTTYKYWFHLTVKVKTTMTYRNDLAAILENMQLSRRIIFGDIYVNLLRLTLRLYRSAFRDSQGWVRVNELKALILLTQLLLDPTLMAHNDHDDAGPAHLLVRTRALSTLHDFARDEFGQAARYNPVWDVMEWWTELTGISFAWRMSDLSDRWEKMGSSARHMGFPSLLLASWLFDEERNVMTPELDKGLQQLEICFGTGPWSNKINRFSGNPWVARWWEMTQIPHID